MWIKYKNHLVKIQTTENWAIYANTSLIEKQLRIGSITAPYSTNDRVLEVLDGVIDFMNNYKKPSLACRFAQSTPQQVIYELPEA